MVAGWFGNTSVHKAHAWLVLRLLYISRVLTAPLSTGVATMSSPAQ